MKISDLLRFSTDSLRRRKGRTALTVIGVVVGTFAIIVLISLGIASNAQNEAMLQSWGDLTQIQIYNYSYGAAGDVPKLDDEMLETFRKHEHVVAATPFYSANNISGSILAGKGDRYEAYIWDCYGVDMKALEAMEFQLQSGSWIADDVNLGKKKIPVLVGANFAYQFQDTRKSYNSGKRQRWAGQTDSLGNPIPPFVDVNKDKLTLKLTAYDTNGNEKSSEYQLVVMGTFVSDTSKHYFTESGIAMRVSDMKLLEKEYQRGRDDLQRHGHARAGQRLSGSLRQGGRRGECGRCGRVDPRFGLRADQLPDPDPGGDAGQRGEEPAHLGRHRRHLPVRGGAEHRQHHDDVHLRAHQRDRCDEGAGL